MNDARQTPLPDLLDQVPEDIVLGIPGDEPVFPSYTNIPIGKLARQAAAELRRLSVVEAQRDALLEALGKMVAVYSGQVQNDGGYTVLDSARPLITDQAAIKAVEENT